MTLFHVCPTMRLGEKRCVDFQNRDTNDNTLCAKCQNLNLGIIYKCRLRESSTERKYEFFSCGVNVSEKKNKTVNHFGRQVSSSYRIPAALMLPICFLLPPNGAGEPGCQHGPRFFSFLHALLCNVILQIFPSKSKI